MPSPISTGPTIMHSTPLMPQHAIVPGSSRGMFCHIQCSTWGRRPFMFSPQSTLGRLVRQMIAISLASPPPSDHRTAEFQWAQNDLTKCCWFTKTQVCLLLKCDDNTQEHNESAGANLFWRKPKKIWSYSALYEDNTPHMCTTLMLENKIIEHCVKW